MSVIKKINKWFEFAIIGLAIITFWSCNDKNENTYYNIPDVYVNKTINLDLPAYQQLNYVGGYYILPNEGYKGIIIYHNLDEQILAMEMACTNNPLDSCATVTVLNSQLFMQCGHYSGSSWIPCCNSKFGMDGSVVEGPARYPLKQYRVSRNGNTIVISN